MSGDEGPARKGSRAEEEVLAGMAVEEAAATLEIEVRLTDEAAPAIAYGTAIRSDLDLGSRLSSGGLARWELDIFALDDDGNSAALPSSVSQGTSHGRELHLRGEDEPGIVAPGARWAFEVSGVVTFQWRSGRAAVYYRTGPEATPDRLRFWCLHSFLPIYLALEEGVDFLHAGCVLLGGETVLFLAPSTGGKSTLTARFVAAGSPLVTDDKLATFFARGRLLAVPAHPGLRAYRSHEDLGPMAPRFASTPAPVRSIYSLRSVSGTARVALRELHGFEKFSALLPGYLVRFSRLHERRLNFLAEVVNAVPVFELDVPWNLERLDEVHAEVVRHIDGLSDRTTRNC